MATQPDETRPLYEGIGHTGLDAALDRFRHFALASNDMEPTLRCVRRRDGRRSWVLDVRMRIQHNNVAIMKEADDV